MSGLLSPRLADVQPSNLSQVRLFSLALSRSLSLSAGGGTTDIITFRALGGQGQEAEGIFAHLLILVGVFL